MKFSATFLISCATVATANFDIYLGQESGATPVGDAHETWSIYSNDPSCSDVENSKNYFSRSDVSSRTGFRCKGGCFDGSAVTDIEELEMHFSNDPLCHFNKTTIYRDRNYDMYGTDGQVYGNCLPFPANSYSCNRGQVIYDGVRKFRCLTHLNVPQIEAGN